jgi:hypothetical protein
LQRLLLGVIMSPSVPFKHVSTKPQNFATAKITKQSDNLLPHRATLTLPALRHRRPNKLAEETVKTALEVKRAIANLIQNAIAGDVNSPFVEAAVSDDKLIVGTRDQDGNKTCYCVCVEETQEVAAPTLATPQSQPQEEAGEAAQASDGCCQGTQTCGEATQASPVQEDTKEETTEPAEDGCESDTPAKL